MSASDDSRAGELTVVRSTVVRSTVVSGRRWAGLARGLALAMIAVLSVAGLLLDRSGEEHVGGGVEMGSAASPTSVAPPIGGGYRSRYGLEARVPARYNLEAAYLQGMSRTTTSGAP